MTASEDGSSHSRDAHGSQSGGDQRYVVEPGIDGSWLVVDLGADRPTRLAIARYEDADRARTQAQVLSQMDALFPTDLSDLAEIHADLPAVLAEYEAAIDAAHNFNHLLVDPPTSA